MADTGKQSPLGMNVLGGILQNRCLQINSNAEFFMGISKSNSDYTYGRLIEGTVLRMLTWAINDGFARGLINDTTYNNLISISGDNNECYALGNSKPPTYIAVDPSGSWAGKTEGSADCKAVEFGVSQGITGALPAPANAGYSVSSATDYGQEATWLPYDTTNANKSITQWGWIRCHALQAHNEFNFHAKVGSEGANLDSNPDPQYENFCGSFNEAYGYAQFTNKTINTANNSKTFLEGTFSNMDDLITGDMTGVSLYTEGLAFDLQQLEKVFDFRRLDRFGFPSTLLQQLHDAGGLTQDLNLNLGAAGLSAKDIRKLSTTKTNGTEEEERKIYTAFLGITGNNLVACASSLTSSDWFLWRCTTDDEKSQIRTLADLLNPWYLFQNSNVTLTVPVYNDEIGRPTGSKTYYLIYNTDGSINSAINTSNVKDIVGSLITAGAPTVSLGEAKDKPTTRLPIGFDSYLGGPNVVVPTAVGLAAAAVRYSFLQISNIEQLTPGELGDCLKFLQTMQDVGPGANGTEATSTNLQKPVKDPLADEVALQIALGSGPGGTFRMMDFFGNMSGEPYAWNLLYSYLAGDNEVGNITAQASISALAAIYQQLFLTVSWEQATISPVYTGTGPYTVTGWTITNAGGGYGRGGAPDPVITFSDGLVGDATIGRSDKDTGSNSTGTFGRVISITGGTGTTNNIPTAVLETPPVGTYGYDPATGGTNSPNGTAYNYNTVTQYYINKANTEITNVTSVDKDLLKVESLNVIWNTMGKQMKVEQRTRYNVLGRVEIERDPFVYTNQDLVTFVDSVPDYSDYKSPQGVGARMTLELIVDRACDVGQNIVAQLRQENNEKALANCGIPVNNNISDLLPPDIKNKQLANGTVEGAKEGIEINGAEFVIPSWPVIAGVDGPIESGPGGIYVSPTFVPISSEKPGSYDPLINGDPNPQIGPIVSVGPPEVIAGQRVPNAEKPNDITNFSSGPGNVGVNNGGGKPGGPRPPFIPKQSTAEAIEHVIHCNCDCWDLIG